MKKYRLGIVGAGKWAENYCRTIETMPEIELVAMARRKNKRPSFIPDTCQLYTNWQDLIHSTDRPDGMIVAPSYPGIIALDYLYYGIPVLSEKPVIANRFLIESLLVNYIHLFSPAFQTLKKIVAGKKILRIVSSGYGPSKTREEFSPLFDYGPHDLSLILALMGKEPTDIHITQHNKTRAGTSYYINLTFDDIKTQSLVGNGTITKARYLSVWYEDEGRIQNIVYNDLSAYKLFIGDKKIDYPQEPTPLRGAIEEFLAMIDSYTPNPYYIDLTAQITKILATYKE
jgi:predicted dehydrogenase